MLKLETGINACGFDIRLEVAAVNTIAINQ